MSKKSTNVICRFLIRYYCYNEILKIFPYHFVSFLHCIWNFHSIFQSIKIDTTLMTNILLFTWQTKYIFGRSKKKKKNLILCGLSKHTTGRLHRSFLAWKRRNGSRNYTFELTETFNDACRRGGMAIHLARTSSLRKGRRRGCREQASRAIIISSVSARVAFARLSRVSSFKRTR